MWTIRKYKKSDQNYILEQTNLWQKQRNLPKIETYDLTKIGSLVMYNQTLVAVAFLRRCEGNIGLFETMITDPTFKPTNRSEILDKLVEHLLNQAKKLKITHVLAYTTNKTILMRAMRHGFEVKDFILLTKALI